MVLLILRRVLVYGDIIYHRATAGHFAKIQYFYYFEVACLLFLHFR